jgi:ribosomal protein S17E
MLHSSPELMQSRTLTRWLPDLLVTGFKKDFDANKLFVDEMTKGLPPHIRKKLLTSYIKRYNSKTAKNAARSANIYIRETTAVMRKIMEDLPFENVTSLYRRESLELEAKESSDDCA